MLAELPVMAHTLVLLRHAKSAYPPGVTDHDRPLNPRGQRDAPVAGRLIEAAVGKLEVALVSTATRAQQTYRLAEVPAGRTVDCPELYLAWPTDMLARIAQETVSSVLVVAHNPGTEDLAAMLTANRSSAAFERMRIKFPTAAFAVLRSDLPFAQWSQGCAELVEFEVGRG